MTTAVYIAPALLMWAVERAGRTVEEVTATRDFAQFSQWLSGVRKPSYSQLQRFARYTHTPMGYFFLSDPPDEPVPIPDFRTLSNRGVPSRPSADLLDTIYTCQRRQGWYRDYVDREGLPPVDFAGTMRPDSAVVPELAETMTEQLHFALEGRPNLGKQADVRRFLIKQVENLGVLVAVTGVVGADTHRHLDPQEFRGFTLFDRAAPWIFVNGADTLNAQVFTLIHELAHVWAGDSGLSDADVAATTSPHEEMWANQVAAEVLVPQAALQVQYGGNTETAELDRLSDFFRASTLTILRRIFDAGWLTWNDYQQQYDIESHRVLDLMKGRAKPTGGEFYKALPYKVGGDRFVRAVVADTLAGNTLYHDAFSLLGTAKTSTFQALTEKVLA